MVKYLHCTTIHKGAKLASPIMSVVVFLSCLIAMHEKLDQNYDTLEYLSKKLRGLKVALVDFSPDWCP